jgi:hypothetical protein
MAIQIKHNFTSAKADGVDSTQVQPSNWNDVHALTMATAKIIGRTTAAAGAAEEIGVGTGLSLSALTLSLVAFTGDAGAGGALGGVPAPASGDAAAGKVLGAGGSWVVVAGVTYATAAQINAMSATGVAISPGNLATAIAETTLTPVSNTITPDLTTFVNGAYTLTTGQALTLANPSLSVAGKQHRIRLQQPASGSVGTITFGTAYKKAAADSAALTASLGAVDYLYLDVRSSTEILYSFKRQVA